MTPPPRQVIGVDIGGTALKLGRFDQSGSLLEELQRATPQPATPGAITSELVVAIEQLDPQRQADAVQHQHGGDEGGAARSLVRAAAAATGDDGQ